MTMPEGDVPFCHWCETHHAGERQEPGPTGPYCPGPMLMPWEVMMSEEPRIDAPKFDYLMPLEQVTSEDAKAALELEILELADKLEQADAIPVREQVDGRWQSVMLSELHADVALRHVARWLRGLVDPPTEAKP